MSQEIINVLDNLGEKFGIAIDWSNENILPYLQDLIHRISIANAIQDSLTIIIGIVLLIIAAKIYKWGNKKKQKESYWEWKDEGILELWAIILLLFIGVVCIFGGIRYVIESIFIPEVTVINYLTNLGG